MVGTGFGGEERVLMSGYRVTCQECGRRYVPTRRQVHRVIVERKERDWLCIHCWLGKRWRSVLYLLVVIVLVGALLCSLTGCGLNGGWGNGPSSDPASLDAERQRAKDAEKIAERAAAERLRKLNPMGGG